MVTTRPSDLPDFSNPPVTESVLSVQFDRLSALQTAHLGLYWSEIRDRFPKTEEHGELPIQIEQPPDSPQPIVGFQFEALEAPPIPRVWFINQEGTELIQVQRDRFITNWRKVGEGNLYPRYERVREGFDKDFADFSQFVSHNQLGAIRVNQCEVTYINHIFSGVGWETHADIGKVFTVWQQPTSTFPRQAQDIAFRARFPISDPTNGFIGRLHVTLQPVKRISDGLPMFLLELTARGLIGEGTDFFDLGRKWIVRSFAELTTPMMHEIWGRRK
ncbi:MAG: TIGR04255 family protein [Terracidiphilus sp.]